MRGVMIIGMLVVLLVIGILVIKNMGAHKKSAVIETQTKQVTQQAKSFANEANARTDALRQKMSAAAE